jgi:phosphomannomutase
MSAPHVLDPSVLREYDIRGVAGETLRPADANAIGRAFGTVVQARGGKNICVGWDGRLSTPELLAGLVEGLCATGIQVWKAGLGPTPMLYYAVHHFDADAGVMITGSHNPAPDNGFKFSLGPSLGGSPFYGEDIKAMAGLAARGELADGPGAATDRPAFDGYVDRLLEDFSGADDQTVIWDCGNGAAGAVADALIGRMAGQHVGLFTDIDGRFPNHHPDPTVAANLRDLQGAVAENTADLGIALDGDGDRIGVVDGDGEILWADQLMVLFARDLLARTPGAPVIADVKASQVLFGEVAAAGGVPVMYKTGHSLIKAHMKALNAQLAGEMSGHIFFADRYDGYDDGLYAGVRLLRILSEQGLSLRDFRTGLPKPANTPELRFPCPEDRKAPVIAEVRDRLPADAEVNDIDGLRVTTEEGWWLLRASNTQSVLVARCEGRDALALSRLKDELSETLALSGLSLPQD